VASAPPPTAPAPRSRILSDALIGDDMGRLLGLSDGVFGFAITFLVVNLVVPLQCITSARPEEVCVAGALGGEVAIFLSYMFSFAVLGIWWVRHHIVFRYIVRYDGALLWANLTFLLTIAITPFILGLLANFIGVEIAVVLFGLVQAAAGGMLVLLLEIGIRANLIAPDANPDSLKLLRQRFAITPLIFLASSGLALISVYIAHFIWAAVFVEIIWTQVAVTGLRGKPAPATTGTAT
jgi:uncharacterized membrane protein